MRNEGARADSYNCGKPSDVVPTVNAGLGNLMGLAGVLRAEGVYLMQLTLMAALLLLSVPAFAQDGKRWEAAPVPGDGVATVAPADRAGGAGGRALNAGPNNATPFSGAPSGTISGGGQTSPTMRDTAGSTEAGTPNLSR